MITTPRLVLRSFEPRDEEAWLAMVGEPGFGRFLPPIAPPTKDSFQHMVERRAQLERDRGHTIWAVEEKPTRTFVGQCGLYPTEWKGPEIELAYHFRTAAQNKGYATEAAIAALTHGFTHARLERIIALVMPSNIASSRVAEKAGMRLEGSASFYGIEELKLYVAERKWWTEAGGDEPASV